MIQFHLYLILKKSYLPLLYKKNLLKIIYIYTKERKKERKKLIETQIFPKSITKMFKSLSLSLFIYLFLSTRNYFLFDFIKKNLLKKKVYSILLGLKVNK